jgi:hypothetical protein
LWGGVLEEVDIFNKVRQICLNSQKVLVDNKQVIVILWKKLRQICLNSHLKV